MNRRSLLGSLWALLALPFVARADSPTSSLPVAKKPPRANRRIFRWDAKRDGWYEIEWEEMRVGDSVYMLEDFEGFPLTIQRGTISKVHPVGTHDQGVSVSVKELELII